MDANSSFEAVRALWVFMLYKDNNLFIINNKD